MAMWAGAHALAHRLTANARRTEEVTAVYWSLI
jgi:hypothetical protein